ncbi:MAG TPA: GTP-binding protein [Gammaproteobacteria bacterium]|nr:GTP-binding protein [Gammaproteobacteria bacterium]
MENDKIIFTGPVGAGKTTAIGAISEEPPVSTDVMATDDTKKMKKNTTVAMDYSFIQLEDGKRVHLYGTPGQDRFDFMWKILVKNGIGLVVLINNDHADPVAQMEFYLDAFSEFIKETAVVIGITRNGIGDQATIEDYQTRLFERGQIVPVFEIDARSEQDVKLLIHALLSMLM